MATEKATTTTNSNVVAFPKGAGVAQPKPMRTWVKDVIGIFGHIESRDTWHELPNGTKVPDTWALSVMPLEVKDGKYVFASKEPVWFNWHTYSSDEQTIQMWDRFDPQIDLAYCAQNKVPLHIWVDDRNRQHLEPAPGIELSQCHA